MIKSKLNRCCILKIVFGNKKVRYDMVRYTFEYLLLY